MFWNLALGKLIFVAKNIDFLLEKEKKSSNVESNLKYIP
jgi:hypothetical protein